MSKFYQNDWFWVVLIVFIVMGFNTVRSYENNSLVQTCLKEHKAYVNDTDNGIQKCQ